MKSHVIKRGAVTFQNSRSNHPASARDGTTEGKSHCFNSDFLRVWQCGENGSCTLQQTKISTVFQVNFPQISIISSYKGLAAGDMQNALGIMRGVMRIGAACHLAATIDSSLLKQMEGERQCWRDVSKKAVAVINLLWERGLAFRGEN